MSSVPVVIRNIILALSSIVIFLALAESIIRFLKIDTHSRNQFFTMNRDLDYPEAFKRDKLLFWKPHSNRQVTSKFFDGRAYNFNSLGLRGTDVLNEKIQPRLIALGNSCTFGWGVSDDQVFTTQLRKLLNGNYEVINAGVPGYSSFQGKLLFETEIARLEPDILLILFAWNDQWLAANDIPDKEQKLPPESIVKLQNLLSALKTYQLMKKVLLELFEKDPDSMFSHTNTKARVSLDDFYINLKSICTRAKENGALPILMTSPIPSLEKYYVPGSVSPLHQTHEKYNQVIRQLASDEGLELVDLALEFDKYAGLFDDVAYDPIHFNDQGHKIAAALIAQKIQTLHAN